jgi:hypothetical protein
VFTRERFLTLLPAAAGLTFAFIVTFFVLYLCISP